MRIVPSVLFPIDSPTQWAREGKALEYNALDLGIVVVCEIMCDLDALTKMADEELTYLEQSSVMARCRLARPLSI